MPGQSRVACHASRSGTLLLHDIYLQHGLAERLHRTQVILQRGPKPRTHASAAATATATAAATAAAVGRFISDSLRFSCVVGGGSSSSSSDSGPDVPLAPAVALAKGDLRRVRHSPEIRQSTSSGSIDSDLKSTYCFCAHMRQSIDMRAFAWKNIQKSENTRQKEGAHRQLVGFVVCRDP